MPSLRFHARHNHESSQSTAHCYCFNNKFLVGKVLGQDGFGITYIGWDNHLYFKVAIKEYYPECCVTREQTSISTVLPLSGERGEYFKQDKENFVQEARTLAKFINLPSVVTLRDFFLERGTAYIVMEYIEGLTLKELLQEQGSHLPVDNVLALMLPALQTLQNPQNDINPDNIMLQSNGEARLLDLGAARTIHQLS